MSFLAFLLAAAVSLFHLGGSSSAFCPVPGARRRDAAVAPLRSMPTSAAENALLSSVVAFPLHSYSLPKWYAYYLFALYAGFLLTSCLVEAGVIPQSALCSFGGPCV